jgi:hypothetical protein
MSDPNVSMHRPMSVNDAAHAFADAQYARAEAEAYGHLDPVLRVERLATAEALEINADIALAPEQPLVEGRGGEVIDPQDTGPVREPPNMLHAQASRDRLALTGSRTTLALDLADSLGVKSSGEKMMVQQMAAAHDLVMRLTGQATRFAAKAEHSNLTGDTRQAIAANIEAARSATAAAKLMEAFQRAMLTFDSIRNGRKQQITVQHVTVQDGGQAVVAGAIKAK